MKIAVIVPAHNEGKQIATVLGSIPREIAGNPVMIIVVDDGSRDRTATYAQGLQGVYIVRHRSHLGRGAAAKTGCDVAFKLGADLFVLMSASGEYASQDLEILITPLLSDSSPKMVLGRQKHPGLVPFSTRTSNALICAISKLMFGIKIHDTRSRFRAFPRSLYPDIRWGACSSAMETEMLILAAQQKATLVEVDISSQDKNPANEFKIEDGLHIVQTLLKVRIGSMREYQPAESPLS